MKQSSFIKGVCMMFVVACLATQSWAGDDPYEFFLESVDGAPGGTVTMGLNIDNSDGDELQGWQWGMCHDTDFLTLADGDVSTEPQSDIDPLLGFTFQAVVYFDGDDAGWTVGCLLAVFPASTLPPGDNTLYETTYSVSEDVVAGDMSTVEFCEVLGSPVVTLAVVVDGGDLAPVSTNGVVNIPPVPFYARGDCNGDEIFNIADGINILSQLFQGADLTECAASCDVNGDGRLDSSDAMSVFNHQFMDGDEPPAPFPGCGAGTAEDDCASPPDFCE